MSLHKQASGCPAVANYLPLVPSPLLPPNRPGIFIGLWLNQNDGETQLLPGGFDGGCCMPRAAAGCRRP